MDNNKILRKYKLLNDARVAINTYLDINNALQNKLSKEQIDMLNNTIEFIPINKEKLENYNNFNTSFAVFMNGNDINKQLKRKLSEKIYTLKYLIKRKNIMKNINSSTNIVNSIIQLIDKLIAELSVMVGGSINMIGGNSNLSAIDRQFLIEKLQALKSHVQSMGNNIEYKKIDEYKTISKNLQALSENKSTDMLKQFDTVFKQVLPEIATKLDLQKNNIVNIPSVRPVAAAAAQQQAAVQQQAAAQQQAAQQQAAALAQQQAVTAALAQQQRDRDAATTALAQQQRDRDAAATALAQQQRDKDAAATALAQQQRDRDAAAQRGAQQAAAQRAADAAAQRAADAAAQRAADAAAQRDAQQAAAALAQQQLQQGVINPSLDQEYKPIPSRPKQPPVGTRSLAAQQHQQPSVEQLVVPIKRELDQGIQNLTQGIQNLTQGIQNLSPEVKKRQPTTEEQQKSVSINKQIAAIKDKLKKK